MYLIAAMAVATLATSSTVQAQTDANPSTMGITALHETMQRYLEQGNFLHARPYLEEMVNRFGAEPPDQRPQLAPVFYYLALSYLQEYAGDPKDELLQKAIEQFERYEAEYPAGDLLADVLMFKGDALRGLGKFEDSVKAHERLLVPPLVLNLQESKRLDALDKVVASYYVLRNWEKGQPWFLEQMRTSVNPVKQAQAAAALIEAYIGQGKFDDARKLLPYIVTESPPRYSLQLNIALLEAGDKLSDAGRISEASLYYYLVLTLDEILAYQTNRLANIRSQLNLLEITAGESDRATELRAEVYNIEQTIAALREIPSYTAELQVRMARNYVLTERNWEAFWAYDRLMQEYPDHPAIEDFTYAAFSQAVVLGLTELVQRIGEMYEKNPNFKSYGRDIAVRMAEFYLEGGQTDRFFDYSHEFIAENPDDEYCSQFVFMMGSAYVNQERYDEMIEDFNQLLNRYPGKAMLDGVNYWLGLGNLFNRNYGKAKEYFETVVTNYPVSPYAEDAFYRASVADFGLENFEGALNRFLQFTADNPDSPLRGEAEFFLGDLYSILGNSDEAIKHYALVDLNSDNLSFIRNAAFLSADIYETHGRYEEMQKVIERFIERHGRRGEHSEALFILGRALGAQNKFAEMDAAFWKAVDSFGNNREASGVDEILAYYPSRYQEIRSGIEENFNFFDRLMNDADFRRTMATDRRAFYQYFFEHPDLDYEFRERMTRDLEFVKALPAHPELVKPYYDKHEARLGSLPELSPVERMKKVLAETSPSNKPTLHFRVMMGLDKAGVEDVVGEVFTPDQFKFASAATIVWMGREAAQIDENTARIAYQTVVSDFPESPAVQDALMALGDLEAKSGNYELALDYYREAQQQFPASPKAVDAVLRQGDALMEMGRYDAAIDRFETILRTREWRGDAHAEAVYKIGQIFFRQGDWERAHAFFERTIAGYGAYREWAAKAYLFNGRALQNLGQTDRILQNDAEFLEIPGNNDLPEYLEILQRHNQMKRQ